MSFSKTTSNIRLDGNTLRGECLLADGKTAKPSSLVLDTVLGNIEGKFEWSPASAFSKSAVSGSVSLKNTTLHAKLKPSKGDALDAQVDLDKYIANIEGVLQYRKEAPKAEPTTTPPVTSLPNKLPIAPLPAAPPKITVDVPVLSRHSSSDSAITAVEETETVHTASSFKSSSTTTSTTKTSSTYIRTMTMDLAQACKKFELKESILSCECLLANGSYQISKIDLNKHIGNIDGKLEWHKEKFTESCKDITFKNTTITAKCKRAKSEEYTESSIDIAEKLRNDNGTLILMAYDEKLSVALSEVPWMKFKVVAEPDFAVIASHPVIQGTLTQIANSTVEHVTSQFEMLMAAALAATIKLVTESAREHIEQSLVVMTQNLAKEAANAHLHSSYTASGYLKSDHQMCGCQPFRCSCPPTKVATQGKGLEGKVQSPIKA